MRDLILFDLPLPTRRAFLLSASALVSSRLLLRGQDSPTFSAGVKVVNVLATVMTKKGAIVRDLNQEDFSIAEDGRPQAIRYFSRQSDLPLVLGLMVDTSMSQERVLDSERSAAFHFLDQVLRVNKDKVFIMQFDLNVWMRQELTGSWKQLNEALSTVNTPSRRELQSQTGGGTLLYDAVITASKTMTSQQGRKALIVMSDGVDNGSEADLSSAIDAAQKADTLIYSILFSDEGAYGMLPGGRDGKSVLVRLAKETGGGFFEVTKKQSIDQIFGIIEEELRSQYALGYVSDQPVRIPEFRKITVKTQINRLIVQARDRYWAQP